MGPKELQHCRTVLSEALLALKALDPYLDANDLEKANLGRHCIRRLLKVMEEQKLALPSNERANLEA